MCTIQQHADQILTDDGSSPEVNQDKLTKKFQQTQ